MKIKQLRWLQGGLLSCALALTVLLAPASRLLAQAPPAVVVSIASVDETMADVGYVTQAAGVPEYANLVTFLTAQYTQQLDTTKGSGVYVTFDTPLPTGVGFIPVKSLDQMLATLENQVGKAEDAGDGVKMIGLQQPVFLKEQGGYAFISNTKEALANPPADPSALLGDLDEKYNVAVQVNVESIPAEMRKAAVDQMRLGLEQQLQQDPGLNETERELQQKLARNSMESMVMLIEQSKQLTIGWSIDAAAKATYLEFSLTAQDGTELAEQMELMQDTRTAFAGFLDPEAAASMLFSSKMPERDKQQLLAMIETVRTQAAAEIDADEDLPSDQHRALVKDVLNSMLDVAKATLQQGELDGGAILILKPDVLKFAAGGHVADGSEFAEAFKKLVKLGEGEPDFPEVQFDVSTHAGISFHTMNVPIPEGEEEAKQIFGDSLQVALGTGENAVYVAFGNEPIETLKGLIDKSAEQPQLEVPPLQVKVAMGPILKFAASLDQGEDPGLQAAIAALNEVAGKDHVTVTATAIDNGVTYRLDVEEGILQVIGSAAKSAGGAGAGGF